MIGALVPVKQLTESKSRLLAELAPDQRAALSLAMLRDVVAALRDSQCIDRIAVVTPDEDVARTARESGADAVLFRAPGLNPSLEAGARALGLGDDDALLVVLGDVAGALPEDLDTLARVLTEQAGAIAVLAPASDGGTAALLRRPPDAIEPCFGRDSALRHREAAERAGVAYRELQLPSLATDLDSKADVTQFLTTRGGGAHTRAALASFDWKTAG